MVIGMKYHIIAFLLGFLLDLLLGDPYWMPHPVRLIGRLIAKAEKCLLDKNKEKNRKKEFWQGGLLVFLVLGITGVLTAFFLFLS